MADQAVIPTPQGAGTQVDPLQAPGPTRNMLQSEPLSYPRPDIVTPPLGYGHRVIRTYRFDVSVVRTDFEINCPGNGFFITRCDDVDTALPQLKYDENTGEPFYVFRGFGLSGLPFRKILVTNVAGTGTLEILIFRDLAGDRIRATNV